MAAYPYYSKPAFLGTLSGTCRIRDAKEADTRNNQQIFDNSKKGLTASDDPEIAERATIVLGIALEVPQDGDGFIRIGEIEKD